MEMRQSRHPGAWLTTLGLCVAMEVILARFLSLHTWNLKIGFSFLPVVAAAYWGGPLAGGLTGLLGDLIGALLFPVGTYFPGFTLTAFLDGAVYGLFFRKRTGLKEILGAVVTVQLGLSLVLNTFWLSLLYQVPWRTLLWLRLFQCFGGLVVKALVLRLALPAMEKGLVRRFV